MLKHKHLIDIDEYSVEEITEILDTAESFKEVNDRAIKKLPTLRGLTIINLFLEPSTRTRTSFEIAGKRLSADVINFSASASATKKGESLASQSLQICPSAILTLPNTMPSSLPQMVQFFFSNIFPNRAMSLTPICSEVNACCLRKHAG